MKIGDRIVRNPGEFSVLALKLKEEKLPQLAAKVKPIVASNNPRMTDC
jgi:hypothetical protein